MEPCVCAETAHLCHSSRLSKRDFGGIDQAIAGCLTLLMPRGLRASRPLTFASGREQFYRVSTLSVASDVDLPSPGERAPEFAAAQCRRAYRSRPRHHAIPAYRRQRDRGGSGTGGDRCRPFRLHARRRIRHPISASRSCCTDDKDLVDFVDENLRKEASVMARSVMARSPKHCRDCAHKITA
jgi:hypothetical protein